MVKAVELKKAEAMVIPDKSKMGISQSSFPAGLLKSQSKKKRKIVIQKNELKEMETVSKVAEKPINTAFVLIVKWI